MWEEILKAIPIYFSSMIKFIFGPAGGYAVGLNLVTTVLATVGGMMTVVVGFTYFGEFIRKRVNLPFFKQRGAKFTERNRRFVSIWKKYGLFGVAALTPLILTPIGGTLLALSFGTPRNKLIIYMFVSAAVWAVFFSSIIYFFGNEVLPDFVKP